MLPHGDFIVTGILQQHLQYCVTVKELKWLVCYLHYARVRICCCGPTASHNIHKNHHPVRLQNGFHAPCVCVCVWIVSMCEDDITISAIMKRKVASCEIKPVIPGQDLKHCPVCFMTWSCKSWVARVEQMGREQKLWSFIVSRWPDKKSFVFGGTEYISCFGRMWASDCEPFSTWCTPIKVYPDWRALAEPGNREVAEKQNYIVSPLKYILVVERLFMQRKKQNLIAKSLKYWLNKRLSC